MEKVKFFRGPKKGLKPGHETIHCHGSVDYNPASVRGSPCGAETPSPKGFQALSQGIHPLAREMHSTPLARWIIILPQYVKTPSPKGFQALSQGIHPLAVPLTQAA
jgi:hypothetical protein